MNRIVAFFSLLLLATSGLVLASFSMPMTTLAEHRGDQNPDFLEGLPAPVRELILQKVKSNPIKKFEHQDQGFLRIYRVEWEEEGRVVEIRFAYTLSMLEHTEIYDATVEWEDIQVQSERRIHHLEELPKGLRQYMHEQMQSPFSFFYEVEEIATSKGIFYEVESTFEGQEVELLMNSEGKILRKQWKWLYEDDDEGEDGDH